MADNYGLGKLKTMEQLDQAQERLKAKLLGLNLEKIQISDYTREYLRSLLLDIDETLGRFNQVLLRGLRTADKPLGNLTILDFGGGAGLLSFLAIEAGAQKVIYNDIFKGSCDDVIQLSIACNLGFETVICGDHTELVSHLNESKTVVDLILSYDVIEHVYDVSQMFYEFQKLIIRPKVLVFGSGANIKNPFYVSNVSRIQQNVEMNDRQDYAGHKKSDLLESYFSMRKKIISRHMSELTEKEVNLLAVKSRGLIEKDILKFVDHFAEYNEFSYTPRHLTNTCDPLTGNWCEQLLDQGELLSLASRAGDKARLYKGKYTVRAANWTNVKRFLMNLANFTFLKFGMSFSPFYILVVLPG